MTSSYVTLSSLTVAASPHAAATSLSPATLSSRSAASRGAAHQEINADGLLLAPGWVDVHTHYDGQATWDELLTLSCWHGATTTVMGTGYHTTMLRG